MLILFIVSHTNNILRNSNNTPSNTHFSIHFFDWLKFNWVPPNQVGPISIWWDPCEF